ncbi:MAG: dihydrolipoyl dehydrogenase [Candidatus Latescibacterota bacterium]
MRKTQVAVLGAGPGGYAAAFRAADLGQQVVLVDPEENPGGVCLHRGCIPSKALLHVARLLFEAREAEAWGVRFGPPQIDVDRLRAWKDRVVARLTGGLGQLARARTVDLLRGTASLADARTLRVATPGGGEEMVEFEHCILASGSRPVSLPGLEAGHEAVWDSTAALALPAVPGSLLVVGGGYIGLELGTVYASLGARVCVVEMTAGLIPPADRDLVKPVQARLEGLFEAIMLQTRVTHVEGADGGLRVRLEPAHGQPFEKTYERVLVAVGRRPNSEGMGLENTRVQLDERGFVLVDDQLRTAEPTLFAIGDLTGAGLAHTATHQGQLAAEVIAGQRATFGPNAIPAVVFTDPELAWCGLTESEARAQGRPHQVARFPWSASGRATTLGRSDGLTKLLVDPESERILGVGVVGPGAGELIAEGVLAMEMATRVGDLRLTIHPHPTLSETLMEAAEVFCGQSAHHHAPRRG